MNLHHDQKRPDDPSAGDSNKLDLRNEIQRAYRSRQVPWHRWVFEHLDLPEQAHVLELGCGSGSLWQENRERIPPGWKLALSDRSHGMAAQARARLAGAGFASLDSQQLPFPAETFDVVLAIGVLDLVADPDRALSEAWRVLRPSGQLIASAGGQAHLLEMRELVRPYLPGGRADYLGGQSERFGLENGAERLATHFEEVFRYDYLDELHFSRLQPILEYVLSEDEVVWDMRLDDLSRFTRDVQRRISEQGRLAVQVQKGIFVARKKIVLPRIDQLTLLASHL
jgi:SAM-dependent methyltransferase